MKELFTIGYVSHSPESFVDVLARHSITEVADVRSEPYSRFRPEFNRETLRDRLAASGIGYVFLGDVCGARPEGVECLTGGRVDYGLLRNHPRFQEGLRRLRAGLETDRIALLCAEQDPIACHRTVLICRNLRSEDIRIRHILPDGSLEEHEAAEERLLKLHDLDQMDLFKSRADRLEEAYDRQGEALAYRVDPEEHALPTWTRGENGNDQSLHDRVCEEEC